MRKDLLAILLLIFVLFESCSHKNSKLIVQNLSWLDSLQVVVSVNGSELFNDKVAKAISNFDAATRQITINTRNVHISAEVPLLKLTATIDSTIDNIKFVYIIVKSEYIPNIPHKPTDSDFLKRERVLISLSNQTEKGMAY